MTQELLISNRYNMVFTSVWHWYLHFWELKF